MTEIFGIPLQAFLSQLLLGLVNGSFYAMLSLGLAVIFGLLNVVNFAHGTFYMLGAFGAWMTMHYLGLNYCLALILEGLFRQQFGVSGQPYQVPDELRGATNLGFMILPIYRAWVVAASLVVCFATWYVIERTKLGAYLRAGTENAALTQAFGVNVPRMVTLTYAFGVALAAFAGVLASPIIQINPLMGANIIIVVFAVVVIGGMGSILGSILTGLGLGVIEGLTKVFYPEASSTVVFVIMAIVLLVRPAGLFGKEK